MFKIVCEDAVLLMWALSCQNNFHLPLCVIFYGLVHFIGATGSSPNPVLHPKEAAKMKLCQTTTTAVLVCSVFLQVWFTVFSKQSFTDIHSSSRSSVYILIWRWKKKKKRPKAKCWTLIMSEHGSTPWLWVFSTFVREVNRFLNFCLTCLVKKSHFPCLW